MNRTGILVAGLVAFEAGGLAALHVISAEAVSRMTLFDPAGLLPLFAVCLGLAVWGELLLGTLVLATLARGIVVGSAAGTKRRREAMIERVRA